MTHFRKLTVLIAACCLLSGCGGTSSAAESKPESKAETTTTVTETTEKTSTTAVTTTSEKKEKPAMTLTKDDEVWKGKFACKKLGYGIELEADSTVSEDYVQRCAAVIENMSDELLLSISEAAKRYCLAFNRTEKDCQGDDYVIEEDYQKVTKDTPAKALLPMIEFDSLYIGETEDESKLFFTLSGGCDWEIEHGVEATISDGKLMYLGGFEDVSSPDQLSYYTEEQGRQWNYALTFEDLTADIITKIEGIEDLDKLEGVSEEEIDKAEQELQLLFPDEYRAILLKYGCISFGSHEWTGLGFEGEGNVIEMTKRERELNEKLPAKIFVLENAGIDGIIIAVNEFGDVFQHQGAESKKIHDSILEYLEWCLRNE